MLIRDSQSRMHHNIQQSRLGIPQVLLCHSSVTCNKHMDGLANPSTKVSWWPYSVKNKFLPASVEWALMQCSCRYSLTNGCSRDYLYTYQWTAYIERDNKNVACVYLAKKKRCHVKSQHVETSLCSSISTTQDRRPTLHTFTSCRGHTMISLSPRNVAFPLLRTFLVLLLVVVHLHTRPMHKAQTARVPQGHWKPRGSSELDEDCIVLSVHVFVIRYY